jgi:hypothetical protein
MLIGHDLLLARSLEVSLSLPDPWCLPGRRIRPSATTGPSCEYDINVTKLLQATTGNFLGIQRKNWIEPANTHLLSKRHPMLRNLPDDPSRGWRRQSVGQDGRPLPNA